VRTAAHANTDANLDDGSHADRPNDAESFRNGRAHSDTCSIGDRSAEPDGDALSENAHADPKAYADSHADSSVEANGHAERDRDPCPDADTYGHSCAAGRAGSGDPEVPPSVPHRGTARLVLHFREERRHGVHGGANHCDRQSPTWPQLHFSCRRWLGLHSNSSKPRQVHSPGSAGAVR